MKLAEAKKENLTISMSQDEASRLLRALTQHADIVGDYGRELAAKLSAAGVQPSAADDHIRYEYMPPS